MVACAFAFELGKGNHSHTNIYTLATTLLEHLSVFGEMFFLLLVFILSDVSLVAVTTAFPPF